MPHYRLLKHKDYDQSVRHLPPSVQQKALWAQVLLGTRGRTPSVKGTKGLGIRWRRTPIQGNHFYMWWIPQSESGLESGQRVANNGKRQPNPSILVHSVRHHDETESPISLGYLEEYEEIRIAELDPRFEEQHRVGLQIYDPSSSPSDQAHSLSIATVKGLPGSGKTISLFYLVRDLLQHNYDGKILYITYTSRLKRAAEEFLLAQDESFAHRVQLKTLNEIQSEITGIPTPAESFQGLADFCKFLDLQKTSSLGPWRRFPHTLYTEIRAYLLGRSFPDNYMLRNEKVGEESVRLSPLDALSYARTRNLDLDVAEVAYKVSIRAAASRFFREQKAAQKALDVLMAGKMPVWLPEICGVIVDEVQDLTLLQIALLGEMVNSAIETQAIRLRNSGNAPDRQSGSPFVFTIAGDESQIVQPTGFDWGITKDLLSKRLGSYPKEYEFQYQRRAPKILARLLENSWNLYGNLPRAFRPSARRDGFIDESIASAYEHDDGGRILLCSLENSDGQLTGQTNVSNKIADPMRKSIDPLNSIVADINGVDWQFLFELMVDKPGRILIDLTEKLRPNLPGPVKEISEEVLFLPREIKGLERSTVIVFGLNAVYERASFLCNHGEQDNLARFEARRLFDEIRVALSRSTHTLVLMESSNAPILEPLGLADQSHPSAGISSIAWIDLIDILQTDEMSELEAIERYLDEVDDLIDRQRWEWAYRRNRRAFSLADEINDHALQREAQNQYVEIHIQEAQALYADEEWAMAYERNRAAHSLAINIADPLLFDRIDEQLQHFRSTLKAQALQHNLQAGKWLQSGSFKIAHRDAKHAHELAEAIQDEAILHTVGQSLITICTRWAYQLTTDDSSPTETSHAVDLLREAISILERADSDLIPLWQVVVDRYSLVPQTGELTSTQLESVLAATRNWVDLASNVKEQNTPPASAFLLRWLRQTYDSLREQIVYYYSWAALATEVNEIVTVVGEADTEDIPDLALTFDLDDYLWDLENQTELLLAENPKRSKRVQLEIDRFNAFMKGYHGDHLAATQAWESLGDFYAAAIQARFAGLPERAYDLYRKSKRPVPEELAISVKSLRLLEQLQSKHKQLTQAEKEALSRRLEQVRAQLEEIAEPGRADVADRSHHHLRIETDND